MSINLAPVICFENVKVGMGPVRDFIIILTANFVEMGSIYGK